MFLRHPRKPTTLSKNVTILNKVNKQKINLAVFSNQNQIVVQTRLSKLLRQRLNWLVLGLSKWTFTITVGQITYYKTGVFRQLWFRG